MLRNWPVVVTFVAEMAVTMKKIIPPTPGNKIAWLFVFLFIGLLAAGLLTQLLLRLPGLSGSGNVMAIYVSAALQSLLATALPAWMVAFLTADNPAGALGLRRDRGILRKILFVFLIYVISYAFVSFLSQWNKGFRLPESMSGLEQAFRTMEDAAGQTTRLLLSGKTIGTLLLNLSVVAGLAAISEEMFFRGALQQYLREWTRDDHMAVWVTAAVFSLVHFQFYGFLPRLFLGAILGYLYVYTANLWVPIAFHFVNNALIVILYFVGGGSRWVEQMEEMPADGRYLVAALASALCTVLLFRAYRRRVRR